MRRGHALLALASCLALVPGAGAQAPNYAPSDPRNHTWVEKDVLAVGGGTIAGENLEYLKAQGFGAIANFRAERNDDEEAIRAAGMEYLYIPVDHAVDMNATQLRTFVAWAKEMERQDRPIYVHCTNGWHRAAAFAAAWMMERSGGKLGADEAFAKLERMRPGSVMRAPSALLAYEAELQGTKPLVVILQSPIARPERGGSMPVVAEVLASGRPAAGAKVHVWSEESRMNIWGHADDDGRFAFTYVGNLTQGMDHLYARAWLEGYESGADDVELFYEDPVPTTRKLEIQTRRGDQGIDVLVLRNGQPYPTRILAWTTEGWFAFDETGTGRATLPFPEEGTAIYVRAESWGTLGDTATLHPPRLHGEADGSGVTEQRDVWVKPYENPPPASDPEPGSMQQAWRAWMMPAAAGAAILTAGLVAVRVARRA